MVDQEKQPQQDNPAEPVEQAASEQTAQSMGRNGTAHPDDPRIRLLLAKLIATLTGMIIGMAVTFVVSGIYSSEFIAQIETANAQIKDAEQENVEKMPVREKARDDNAKAYEAMDRLAREFKPIVRNGEETTLLGQLADRFEELKKDRGGTLLTIEALESDITLLIPRNLVSPSSEPVTDSEAVTTELNQSGTWDPEAVREIAQLYLEYKRSEYDANEASSRISFNNQIIDTNTQTKRELEFSMMLLNLIGLAIIFFFTLVGYLSYPIANRLLNSLTKRWTSLGFISPRNSTQAIFGFFAGLLLAVILLLGIFTTFGGQHSVFDNNMFKLVIGTLLVVIMGGIGAITGATYFGPREEFEEIDEYAEYRRSAAPKLLDSSVIIDGRIYEIAQTRFLDGYLIVTGSVLRELQTLADSADDRKRTKGRSGLELVQKMQDDSRVDLRIFDDSQFDNQANGTDDQLMIVCREMGAQVVTNDYNLNRVAAILNVKVLNINALANAVKTKHLPGDYIEIKITDRGKQKGQGVGYLEDGTMVVIEDGGGYIGQSKLVRITSVSQTAQGRLLFARVDLANGDGNG